MQVRMNMQNNRTGELWSRFAPRIREIHNRISSDKFSLQIYPDDYFVQFDPTAFFDKWALVEVEDLSSLPDGMEQLELPGGLYAVFDYKGLNTDAAIFEYIFTRWLPASEFEIDNRPHFEVLGEKYRNNDPESEEEIWIPVRKKSTKK